MIITKDKFLTSLVESEEMKVSFEDIDEDHDGKMSFGIVMDNLMRNYVKENYELDF